MRTFLTSLVGLFLLASTASHAQVQIATGDGFGIRGNKLGMSLEQFRAANPGITTITVKNTANVHARSITRRVVTPLCSDQFQGFEGDTGQKEPGEVLCNASPNTTNPYGRWLFGMEAQQVLYHFSEGKLNRIEIRLLPSQYETASFAFKNAYGEPQPNGQTTAATQNMTWRKDAQSISIFTTLAADSNTAQASYSSIVYTNQAPTPTTNTAKLR